MSYSCKQVCKYESWDLVKRATEDFQLKLCSYGTALMQRHTCLKHFARHMLALDVYHLESSSLQLKNNSTLGKLYKARLFYLKTICCKAFHHFKYLPSTCVSLNVRLILIMPNIVLSFVEIT